MKSQFEIQNYDEIKEILDNATYGTLALCSNNIPYSVPINFVCIDDDLYFHGSKSGKKMKFIHNNSKASFSVVESYSMIQSYFSSDDDLACPATHFFKSVCINGDIKIITDYKQKVEVLQALMEKLQPEGLYKPLSDEVYKKMINATEVFMLKSDDIKGKVKLGQHLPKDRFDKIIKHLQNRNSDIDKKTLKSMIKTKGNI